MSFPGRRRRCARRRPDDTVTLRFRAPGSAEASDLTILIALQSLGGPLCRALYPIVRKYVAERCFGGSIDLESDTIRSHLRKPDLQEGTANYIARKASELTVEKKTLEFENAKFKLSEKRDAIVEALRATMA